LVRQSVLSILKPLKNGWDILKSRCPSRFSYCFKAFVPAPLSLVRFAVTNCNLCYIAVLYFKCYYIFIGILFLIAEFKYICFEFYFFVFFNFVIVSVSFRYFIN